jgi:hypothetical protein
VLSLTQKKDLKGKRFEVYPWMVSVIELDIFRFPGKVRGVLNAPI